MYQLRFVRDGENFIEEYGSRESAEEAAIIGALDGYDVYRLYK